ncbi:MAG: DUF3108 domain-containing protein [Gammaproteobacteria bacterium]|nr:DUF3108 domain-containing protein [Gammaproteobacteria bacterium]
MPSRTPCRQLPLRSVAPRFCRVALIAIALLAPTAAAKNLFYDARVGWLDAGAINITFTQDGDQYELSGSVRVRGAIAKLVRWRGWFAATGKFAGDWPRTDAYLLMEENRGEREVLLSRGGRTVLHGSHRDSEELEGPPGSDIMSVLFLAPHCLDGAVVHDGEDPYRIRLRKSAPVEIKQPQPWYSGAGLRCDYDFRYRDGSTRRVSLWVANVQGEPWPVRIRVRVPLRPDGLLRLRVGADGGDDAAPSIPSMQEATAPTP